MSPKRTTSLIALCSLLAIAAPSRADAAPKGPRMNHQTHPESSPILASYDFEKSSPSGPDTFWVRESGDGEVALSKAFRVSGERSLRISEVPGNRDFAEFLAYFRETRDGAVFIQFYLLVADPEQRFNFGLAGPRWFLSTERHGQAIWLQTDAGYFRHRTHAGWEDLFAPTPFAWYLVDIVYHVDAGRYDLRIVEEGADKPAVDLRQVRSMNGHEGSAVEFFSLIGDLEDAGRFDFFVDDLVIATDPEVLQKPFVAPGRRRFFVDTLAVGEERRSGEKREALLRKGRRWLEKLDDGADTSELDRLEEAADEAFRARDLDLALRIYERLRRAPDRHSRILLKLADVHHLLGGVASERSLRESLYGSLKPEEYKP
jgi:hypothetical protein